MCCLMSVFFTTAKRIHFWQRKALFSESTGLCLLQKTSHFMHRDHTWIACTPIWRVTLSQLDPTHTPLLWVGCRSPALSHTKWKPGEGACKNQVAETAQNAAFQWLKGIKVKVSASVGPQSITSHNYMPRKAQGTVLQAQRRQNSPKRDSKQESADGSRAAGAAAAGAAISAVRWPAVMSPWQRRKGSEQGRAPSLLSERRDTQKRKPFRTRSATKPSRELSTSDLPLQMEAQ